MTISKMIGIAVTVGLGGLFVWECVARKRQSKIIPSVALSYVSTKAINFFTMCGQYLAWLSSYIHQIDFDIIKESAQAVFEPIFNILISPFYTIKGYLDAAGKYKYPILIFLGSFAVMLAVMFGINYWYGITWSDCYDYMSSLGNKLSNMPTITNN